MNCMKKFWSMIVCMFGLTMASTAYGDIPIGVVPLVAPTFKSVSVFFEPTADKMKLYEELVSPFCMPEEPVVRVTFAYYPELALVKEVWVHVLAEFDGEERWRDLGSLIPLNQAPMFAINLTGVRKMPVGSLSYRENRFSGDVRAKVKNPTGLFSSETILDFDFDSRGSSSGLPAHIQKFYDDPKSAFELKYMFVALDGGHVEKMDNFLNANTWGFKTKDKGSVRVRLRKPSDPLPSFDSRWMDLFPSDDVVMPAIRYNWKYNLDTHFITTFLSGEPTCLEDCAGSIDPYSPIQSDGSFRSTHTNSGDAPNSAIDSRNVRDLELDQVFVDGIVPERRGTPAVTDQAVFLISGNKAHAIDRETGCAYWTHKEPTVQLPPPSESLVENALRSASVLLVEEPTLGKRLIITGTNFGKLIALDAGTGDVVWSRWVNGLDRLYPMLTGGIQYHDGTLYVPVATKEILTASVQLNCCYTKGKLLAIDSATGDKQWEYYPVPEPIQLQHNGLFGYGGGSIWSTPLLDHERNSIYIGVSTALTRPVTETSNSMVAVDMTTGQQKWSFRGTDPRALRDNLNGSCLLPYPLNVFCDALTPFDGKINPTPRRPFDRGPADGFDFDMISGSLATTADGTDILIAPSKSGFVYGVNPDDGTLIWENQLGGGGKLGGVHWGVATDSSKAYVAIADADSNKNLLAGLFSDLESLLDFILAPIARVSEGVPLDVVDGGNPGIYALDLETGAIAWEAHPKRTVDGVEIDSIVSAAVNLSNDLVFTGSLDGMVRAFHKDTGEVLWSFDSTQVVVSPGGQPGHGGTIDSTGPVAVQDQLFVNSGYSTFGGTNEYQAGPGGTMYMLKLR